MFIIFAWKFWCHIDEVLGLGRRRKRFVNIFVGGNLISIKIVSLFFSFSLSIYSWWWLIVLSSCGFSIWLTIILFTGSSLPQSSFSVGSTFLPSSTNGIGSNGNSVTANGTNGAGSGTGSNSNGVSPTNGQC